MYIDGVSYDKAISALYPEANKTYYAYLTLAREFIPNMTSSTTPFSIGNSTTPWSRGYFNELYVNGKAITNFNTSIYSTATNSHYITLNGARELIPNTTETNFPFSIGSTSYPWDYGYFKAIYLNGNRLETYAKTSISTLYNTSSHYITFNSSGQLIPNTSSSSYNFELGSNSLPWDRVNVKTIYHTSGNAGFFGVTPVSRRNVNKSTGTPTVITLQAKINEIITALHQLGLFLSI